MPTVNFYLDRADKKGYSPIHLRINCNGESIKVSTGEKVKSKDFDKTAQRLKPSAENQESINHYLAYLKERAIGLFSHSYKNAFSSREVKQKLLSLVDAYKNDSQVNIVKEQLPLYGQSYTFIDFFAGAGGFSEGFLQAEVNKKYFDFLLASDINENCELTHIVRYNHQLNLDAEFLKQDITEPDFLKNLLKKLDGKRIDVITGGPPCQSFSLAGKRKKFDKKDDLFAHYLNVIKVLQPKYFVMENVKGILTKEKGKIKELILNEINSIVDIKEIPKLSKFVKDLKKTNPKDEFILNCYIKRISMEQFSDVEIQQAKEDYIKSIEIKFRNLTPKLVDYKSSKVDKRISTIRHGLSLLLRNKEFEKIKYNFIKDSY